MTKLPSKQQAFEFSIIQSHYNLLICLFPFYSYLLDLPAYVQIFLGTIGASPLCHPRGPKQSPKGTENTIMINRFGSAIFFINTQLLKGIIWSAVSLPCLLAIVKYQWIAAQYSYQESKSCGTENIHAGCRDFVNQKTYKFAVMIAFWSFLRPVAGLTQFFLALFWS